MLNDFRRGSSNTRFHRAIDYWVITNCTSDRNTLYCTVIMIRKQEANSYFGWLWYSSWTQIWKIDEIRFAIVIGSRFRIYRAWVVGMGYLCIVACRWVVRLRSSAMPRLNVTSRKYTVFLLTWAVIINPNRSKILFKSFVALSTKLPVNFVRSAIPS